MAAVAAGRRIEISEEVTRGIRRKLEVGGKPGYAPLGYLNVGEPLPHGGEVRIIVIDSERSPIIRWGFETYATGLYSLTDMVALLAARGLRTRGNCRYSPRPLSLSAVHKLFSNPFYAGFVPHKGKVYPGRHTALIDEELFEQVQAVLKAHNKAGERDRKHQHYLKGTVRCGHCGQRLTYSLNKGNGGTYAYFVCANGQQSNCESGYRRVETIEGLIEDHYAMIKLSQPEQEQVVGVLEQRLAKLAAVSKQELRRCHDLLAGLKEQEKKLLRKHYQDDISDELFHEEAERIKAERKDAEGIVNRLTIRHDELRQFVGLALRLATANLHDLYLRAKPSVRRLMNQAIFEAIWIETDEHNVRIYTRLASPFADVLSLRDELAKAGAYEHDTASDPLAGSEAVVVGSITDEMVGETGFEPATARPPAGCATRLRHSPWCLIFVLLKRATGIEPALEAWKASVQPQHFARKLPSILPAGASCQRPKQPASPISRFARLPSHAACERTPRRRPSPTRSIVCPVPFRPLLLVAALAGGDYLLWTWSSDGGSTTIALISGLALAPLILALIWLLSIGVARTLLTRSATRPASSASTRGGVRGRRRSPLARRRRAARGGVARSASAAGGWKEDEDMSARASGRQAASEKIAA
jgi:site-specific DNA recombinase